MNTLKQQLRSNLDRLRERRKEQLAKLEKAAQIENEKTKTPET